MSDWFQKHREDWILETIQIFGFINRIHVCRKFGVSTAQASVDLQRVQHYNPDVMVYNNSAKRYEAA